MPDEHPHADDDAPEPAVEDAPDPDAEHWWERAYASDDPVPWDTGGPQPVVESLADAEAFADPVLDVGCGLGTHALHVANAGYDVKGVDLSRTAIAAARDAAAAAGVDATFAVGDALDLGTPDGAFGANAVRSVLDVGTLHTFDAEGRGAYADALARVLAPGGRAFVLSFGPDAPEDAPPNRISRDAVRDAFDARDWSVVECRDDRYVTTNGPVPALLAVLERVENEPGTADRA